MIIYIGFTSSKTYGHTSYSPANAKIRLSFKEGFLDPYFFPSRKSIARNEAPSALQQIAER